MTQSIHRYDLTGQYLDILIMLFDGHYQQRFKAGQARLAIMSTDKRLYQIKGQNRSNDFHFMKKIWNY